jgi:hypothetical protein
LTSLKHLASVFCFIALGAAGGACGDGGAPPSPTATAEPSSSPQFLPTVTEASTPDVAAAAPVTLLDLATDSPVLTIFSADGGDLQTSGVSVAKGDFNGDDVDDLLLGAPFGDGPDNSRQDAGDAYVILGSGALEAEIHLGQGAVDLTIFGALPGDNLGFSVFGGDLNGDGIDDVIVGAPASNALTNIRTDMGEAYVVFGSPSLGGTVDLAEIEQDFTFRPAEGFTRVGASFAVGDVNDDGVADLIAGGPFGGRVEGTPPGSPRTTEGEVYVVFGAADLSGEKDVARGEEDARLKGAQEFDSFGQAVASGDVNGDGKDDIIATARRADGPNDSRVDAGEAYVFFGSSALSGKLDSDEADVTIYGAEEGDMLGDLAACGDLNGDGLMDIVLSARFADGPGNLRALGGEAHVIFGSGSLGGVIDLADDAPDAVVYGRDGQDWMPSALALADVNGDGRDDVALGSAFADGPKDSRSDGGEAYVLSGDVLEGEIDLRTDVDRVVFVHGSAPEEQMGAGLLWLDLDDDDRQELLLLAPGHEDEADAPDRLYLVVAPIP